MHACTRTWRSRPGVRWPLVAAFGLLSTATSAFASVLHVDDDAAPGGDGLSWETAFNDLTDAIQAANTSVTQIWVAAGTYTPTQEFSQGSPDSVAFWLLDGLAILGGFLGNESDPADRDPAVNVTILSGELGDPDDPTDNACHVLRAKGTHPSAVLDGFVITGGYADFEYDGGGVRLDNGSPSFINCKFIDNFALHWGGAAWGNSSSSPTFIGCSFTGNSTPPNGAGSAIFCHGTVALTDCVVTGNVSGGGTVAVVNATVTNCLFDGNSGAGGGGALGAGGSTLLVRDSVFANNQSTLGSGGAISHGADVATIVNCLFINNSCQFQGGAIESTDAGSTTLIGCTFLGNTANEGGAVKSGGQYDLTVVLDIINCTFSGNSALTNGGAVSCPNTAESTIVNSTLVGNSAGQNGGGIYSTSAVTTLANDVLWSNADSGGLDQSAQVHASGALAASFSLIQGWTGGGAGNIDADPIFVDAAGADFTPGTTDDDLRLLPGSPCIDAADNTAVPADTTDLDGDADTSEPIPFDAYGGARFYDDPATLDSGQGTPPIVDMGSHEFDETTSDPGPHPGEYVGPASGSWFDPGNWAGGAVPRQSTNVLITTTVIIDQPGALANIIIIADGGTLLIMAGSLEAERITVKPGGVLMLNDPTAALTVGVLTVQGSLEWIAGSIHMSESWTDLNPIAIGCAGSAQLIIGDGATVNAPAVTVCSAGSLGGSGTILSDVANGGTVAPGTSTGTLTIDGTYSQSASGTLVTGLAGYAAGEFDQLVVGGSATLGGTLQVVLAGGFAPQLAGDQRLVVAPVLTGTFDSEIIPPLPGLFLFELDTHVPLNEVGGYTVQLLTTLSSSAPRIYVSAAAAAGGDGQSWKTATNGVQSALGLSRLLAGQITEIWVAAGTYRPDVGTGDRDDSFELSINGLSVYGGFAGGETDLGERDVEANPTILSGDLAGNDGPDFSGNGENSYHVVTTKQTGACELILEGICVDGLTQFECQDMGQHAWLGYGTTCSSGAVEPIRLDGFTIAGGNANHPTETGDKQGGGIRNVVDDLVLENCTLTGNAASLSGGAMFDAGLSTIVSHCEFSGNTAAVNNGGYAAGGPHGPPGGGGSRQISDCLFELNDGGYGGGAWVSYVLASFTRCTFRQNPSDTAGAIYIDESTSVALVDCLIEDNTGNVNASYTAINMKLNSSLSATNCTFSGNSPGAINNQGGILSLTGCLFDGNTVFGAIVTGYSNAINLTAVDTTFSNNSSDGSGGAIHVVAGDVELTNCTFIGNTAAANGGGLYLFVEAAAVLDGVTFEGNTATAGSGIYNYLGELRGTATMLGDDELFNGWHLEVGLPGDPPTPGVISIDGTFHHAHPPNVLIAPELRLDIGGPDAGSYDRIDASQGEAILGGGLLLAALVNGFEPESGQDFALLASPSISGAFDLAVMPALAPGLFFDLSYRTSGLSATVGRLDHVVSFEAVQPNPLDGTPTDAALADMDNDGDLDLVMVIPQGANPGLVSILLNAGLDKRGKWQGFPGPALTKAVGVNPSSVDVGFVNGDSFTDVAVANLGSNTVSVLFNDADGTGNVTLNQNYAVASFPLGVALGRVPGDLSVNMVSASDGGQVVRHFTNNGSGLFMPGQSLFGSTDPVVARLADLDLDGDDDLAIARARPAPQPYRLEVSIYNSGSGLFGAPAIHEVAPGTTDLRIEDLNGDLYPEIVTNGPATGVISIAVNRIDLPGTYSVPVSMHVGNELDALAIADLDVDGDRDLATAVRDETNQPAARVVRNDQNGEQLTLATAADVDTGGDAAVLLGGDLDGDTVPDLVAIGAAGAAMAGTLGVLINSTLACLEDLNRDGTVDVVDFLSLLQQWGSDPGGPPDFNGDGFVGAEDFGRLLLAWGPCP